MKVRVLTGLILGTALLAATPANAQATAGAGVVGGVNFSTVSGDLGNGVTKKNLVSGTVGAFGTARLTDMVQFEPGVMYSREGVKATISSIAGEAKFNINVIRFPLLFRLSAVGGRGGYVIAGPSIGVIASAKQDIPGEGTTDVSNDLKAMSIDIVVGAGVQMSKLFVEGRYSAGVNNINKESSDTNKLRTISVLAGLRF